jgi:glycosyltransferase involved in cell wall biosynthesis
MSTSLTKICHVIITLNILGGAERMLVRLLMSNLDVSDKRMVLVLRHAGDWGDQLRLAGVTVHELGMESALDIPRVFLQLQRFMHEFNPDIVQTWMYHADLLGGLASWFSGYKNIIWGIRRTSLSFYDTKTTWLIMKVCAWLSFWLPRKIISVAEAGRQAHIQSGYNADLMVVIPNGFDFENLTATVEQRNVLRSACGLLDDDIVIGSVGRFNPAKGQDNFIKAAALINDEYPNIKFMLVGTNCDTSNTQLTAWITQNKLQSSFVLLGIRQDIPICLAAMDIFCMPSRTEGFPNALGEAMAMGLPCVATDVGDTRLLVGDTAILVAAQDELALANALTDLVVMTKEQLFQIGEKAKTRVYSEFSMEKACQRFNDVYYQLISKRGS